MIRLALLFLLFFIANCDEKSIIVGSPKTSIYDSGGLLMPEQAAFDVNFYDLNLKVDPERKWIGGSLGMICTATKPLDVIVLQLDTLMKISRISGLEGSELKWKHIDGLVLIYPDKPVKVNNRFFAKIEYSGHPLEVKEPKRFRSGQTQMMSYEFVNAWPTNLTSMRVAYGDSNVLRCAVQFAYDRFFTSFDRMDGIHAPIDTPFDLVNSNDIVNNQTNIINRPDLKRKADEKERKRQIVIEQNKLLGVKGDKPFLPNIK